MVREERTRGKKYFICEECLLKYTDKKFALKCEKWCKKNKSCNLEITRYAIKSKNK